MAFQRIRRDKSDNFTTINNAVIRDTQLSLKAKGLMLTVMGLPESWDFTIAGLIKIVKEGKAATYAAIKELRESGYVTLEREYDKGKIVAWNYVFREQKLLTDFQEVENQEVENLDVENRTQYKKQRINDTSNQETFYPRSHIPINQSLDLELNIWLGAVAVAVGAKDRRSLPKPKKWEAVCMTAIREERDLSKFLSIIETEKVRLKDQMQFFSADTCLQMLQMNGSKAKQSKWMHEV